LAVSIAAIAAIAVSILTKLVSIGIDIGNIGIEIDQIRLTLAKTQKVGIE
jgi:hypothetical protein